MKSFFLFCLILGASLVSGCGGPGELDVFAQCITDAGAVMYGADWCPHCQEQKELFGRKSFKLVNYVECEQRPGDCLAARIDGYPTWILGEERLSGKQSLETLSEKTGCPLPEETS